MIFRESHIILGPFYREGRLTFAEKSLSKIKVLTAMEKDNEGFIALIFPFQHPLIIPMDDMARSGTYGGLRWGGECRLYAWKGIIEAR